jgi:hypothetical protein
MFKLRQIATIAAIVIAAVLAIGINRIVVTDGHIRAAAATAQPREVVIGFKSDYFPLDR